MKALLVGKECPHTKEKSSGKQNKVSTFTPPCMLLSLLVLCHSVRLQMCPRAQPAQGAGHNPELQELEALKEVR